VAYAVRSENVSVLKIGLFSNRSMQWAVSLSLVMLLLVLYVPGLQKAFDTVTLEGWMWGLILPLVLFPALTLEVRKLVLARRRVAETA
jgi:Ca2+-transporting ATPase